MPTVFRDGAANGIVTGVEPPFGNLETSFIESDLRALGITVLSDLVHAEVIGLAKDRYTDSG